MMKGIFFIGILFLVSVVGISQNAIVRGSVYDSKSGESMPGVAIVVKGTSLGTTTDLDGKFSIQLSPGNYTLEISFISYKTYVISDINLKPGQVYVADNIMMTEESIMLNEITVVSKEVRNTENALIAMKRNSVNTIDGISAVGIKRTGDSDVAQTMKRVTGVSVSGGKYVFVRGLGDRYTKTILNGLDIPGLDPDRNTVQMDLFPTNIINNLIVIKTFSADVPADFTGGVINIETKDFPDEKTNSLSISGAYKPGVHFNENFLTYSGGKLDLLGIDDGTRTIPAETNIPHFAEVIGRPDGEKAMRYREILSKFNPEMAAKKSKSLMDFEGSYNIGNQTVFRKYNLGYNFALSYKYSTEMYEDALYARYGMYADKNEYELERRELQQGNLSKEEVYINTLAGFAIKTKNSKYRINLLHIQNAEKGAAIFDYDKTSQGTNFSGIVHTLDFSQRSISNIIIDGKHNIENKDLLLDWKISPTLSLIRDPDVRFTRYEDRQGVYSISTESGFPERIWRKLTEYNISALASATKNTKIGSIKTRLKFGISNTFKNRSFIIRNFMINIRNVDLTGEPDEIFKPENLWPKNDNIISGTTYEAPFIPNNPNQFISYSNTSGAYFSTEFSPFASFKFIAGMRLENYIQLYTGRDQLGYNVLNNDIVINETKIFPTLNVIYSISEKQNLRLNASRTVARPSFKEMSYAEIFDPISGRTFIGGMFRDANDIAGIEYWNGKLVSTDIYNFDIRWELFGKASNFVSLSAFGKLFEKPIEIVQFATQIGAYQPRNVGNGQLVGAEAELKTDLGFISKSLSGFGLNANYTYVYSRIELSKTEFDSRVENARSGQEISKYRDMAGQAPHIINFGITYQGDKGIWNRIEAGLYYNVQGRTLLYAGIADRPDIYSNPFHSLNFNSNFKIKDNLQIGFKVDNLLNATEENVFVSYMAQDQLFSSLRKPRTFRLKVVYDFK